MSIRTAAIVAVAVLGLAACDGGGTGRPLPPPPAPPVPPSPDLPLTGVKAREIINGLPLNCREMASLKTAILLCEERQGRPADVTGQDGLESRDKPGSGGTRWDETPAV